MRVRPSILDCASKNGAVAARGRWRKSPRFASSWTQNHLLIRHAITPRSLPDAHPARDTESPDTEESMDMSLANCWDCPVSLLSVVGQLVTIALLIAIGFWLLSTRLSALRA